MQVIIYQIWLKGTDKCYIGSTINKGLRKSSHLSLLNNGRHHSNYLQNAWKKYGGKKAFGFRVVEEFQIRIPSWVKTNTERKRYVKSKIEPRETWWIENTNSCYNGIKACNGAFIVTQATRRKMSKARRARVISPETRKRTSESMKGKRVGANHPMFGKHHSEESKAKTSKTLKERKVSVGRKNPMFGRCGEKHPRSRRVSIKGKVFPSLTSAAQHFGIALTTMYWRINDCDTPQWKHWKYT